MITYKTLAEIEQIKENCLLVSRTLAHVASMLKPGVTGLDLDKEAETFIRDHGATPAFKGYPGTKSPFPGTLCISPNDQIVHGIPTKEPFKEGDVVSLDCGVKYKGFFGDSAYTFYLCEKEPKEDIIRLLQVTNESLYKGISAARVGNRIGDIGFAIQTHAERKHGYGIVRQLVGHGIGAELHEPPEVPNFGRRGKGQLVKPGLCIAIEPMVNMGTKRVKQYPDGWTLTSRDHSISAHFEHSIAITKTGPVLLSDHSIVEDQIIKNANIWEIERKH